MSKYKHIVLSTVIGIVIGGAVVYFPFNRAQQDALEVFNPQKQLAMDFAYEIPILLGAAAEVREGNISEFYRLTCLRVKLELKTIENEIQPQYRENRKVEEAIEMAKTFLTQMKNSSECNNV